MCQIFFFLSETEVDKICRSRVFVARYQKDASIYRYNSQLKAKWTSKLEEIEPNDIRVIEKEEKNSCLKYESRV